MFDLGWGELVVVGVIALIVIGPKELPTVLRTLGQTLGKVKRMASEFQGQFQDALREVELGDLKKQAEDFTSDFTSSVSGFTDVDPLADAKDAIEHSFDSTPNTEAVTEEPKAVTYESAKTERRKTEASEIEASETEPAAESAAPAAADTPAEQTSEKQAVDIPVPEPAAPVDTEDLASVERPPKPVGGSA